ncbi:hypothetical protein FH972_019990 [Carpinus fangiana]|uniref:Uncharacterized protein n=1 Tax=Carpinus fangiana TaxID=176857 RepID=A0A5N6RRU6_9ROSI|nr:hypothetical protein FH972_019990 [Carpinus fangiana]
MPLQPNQTTITPTQYFRFTKTQKGKKIKKTHKFQGPNTGLSYIPNQDTTSVETQNAKSAAPTQLREGESREMRERAMAGQRVGERATETKRVSGDKRAGEKVMRGGNRRQDRADWRTRTRRL